MRETISHQVREALQRELGLTQYRRAGERLLLFPGAVRPRSKEFQNGGVRKWQEGLGNKGRLGERAWSCGRLPPAPASAQDPESLHSLWICVQGLVQICPSQRAPWLLQSQAPARLALPLRKSS